MRSILDLPPGVDPVVSKEQPKGCRVRISVEEPGFSDARVLIKFPHEDVGALEIRAGESIELVVKGWIRNSIIVEALPREGDPADPDLEGGVYDR